MDDSYFLYGIGLKISTKARLSQKQIDAIALKIVETVAGRGSGVSIYSDTRDMMEFKYLGYFPRMSKKL